MNTNRILSEGFNQSPFYPDALLMKTGLSVCKGLKVAPLFVLSGRFQTEYFRMKQIT